MERLRATYRVQLRPEFTLSQAAEIVPYLGALGVSHLYSSPFLQAAQDSTHGYDVVDFTHISRDLGGEPALERLTDALRGEAMGHVLDMVPNHMAISPANPWWWDVLQNGPSSQYASYFDVEWDPPETRHANAVLVPVLGDHYGQVLEAGQVKVSFDGQNFNVRYFDNVYPVDPHSLGGILAAAADQLGSQPGKNELAFLAGAHDRLPDADVTDLPSARRRYRDAQVLRDLLARLVREQPGVGEAIQETVEAVNQDPDALDAFLHRQNYRLAYWKIAARELGYRRFFDINTMIGLRMEDEEVYQDTHALVLYLVQRGMLDGLRIDHPDGLRDPQRYLERLRANLPQNSWVVVEKILETGERLPATWPVQGTTGYDFLNRVNGLFVDPDGEEPLTDFYTRFTGLTADYSELVHDKKYQAAKEVLGSDLARLTELFLQASERHRRYSDFTRSDLHEALAETAACLPVYRTYIQPDQTATTATNGSEETPGVSPADKSYIDEAVAKAKARRPDLDPGVFDFLYDLLLLRERGPVETELVARFQQFSGPVMAKGVEDTTFYIFNRLTALNEVGGDPARFGVSPAEFHQANAEAQVHWPLTLLTTSTHDTKRSEDVRARLDVLSEMPGEWAEAVQRWSEMNEQYRVPARDGARLAADAQAGDGLWPDRNAEYLLYQTLVGAWPISVERVVAYMEKAGREAKVYTRWTAPNSAYEEAVAGFARAILDESRFVADLETFVASILEPGRINSLSQTLLKITSPGVPDFYQGTELWDLSLVDPDNRRPVDYNLRRQLLDGLDEDTPPERVLQDMRLGLPKLWVIRNGLALRRAHPDWFGPDSHYTPLAVRLIGRPAAGVEPELVMGEALPTDELHPAEAEPLPEAINDPEDLPRVAVTGSTVLPDEPAVAFLRGENVLVAVPRLSVRFRPVWDQYTLTLPEGRWQNRLTHEIFSVGEISLAQLWDKFPAALLVLES